MEGMAEDDDIEIDPVAVVARITTLEMLVRQMMVVQLKMLDRMGHIKLDAAYVAGLSEAYAAKVDESKIIDSGATDVNYAFKMNVLAQLERFFDEIGAHLKENP